MKILKAMRVEQWLKNVVIFFPFFLSGNFNLDKYVELLIVFFGFSLIVSSTYIVNDLLDIDSDKLHPIKKHRPVASGYLIKKNWVIILIFLSLTGFYIIYQINSSALIFCCVYVILTVSYSVKLKYVKYIDLLTISTLFLLRILLGGIPLSIPISNYLLIFIFAKSLQVISSKKYSILVNSNLQESKVGVFLSQKYTKNHLLLILKISIFISLLIYILWIFFEKSSILNSERVIYLFLSFVLISVFDFKFLEETKKGKTEDIIYIFKNNRKILVSLILFAFFSLIGII